MTASPDSLEIAVRLRNIVKTFDTPRGQLRVLDDFNADFVAGKFSVILGPSGCGKSTVIRLVAGLEKSTSGSIKIWNKSVTKPVHRCGMVFQTYTSFPWLSVIENIAFGLKYTKRNQSRKERLSTAHRYADLVGLSEFQHAQINQLSGGMRQRVALASSLAIDPDILLMDEPFGALDSQTRMLMQEHLISIVSQREMTVLFVTHDIDEALLLADRIYVCSARPAKIIADYAVPFPHPRSAKVRNDQLFFRLKHEIFHLLRDDVYRRMMEKEISRGVFS